MTPGIGVERRNAHQAVHAGLGLQPAIGVFTRDLQRDRLDAGLFARRFFLDVDGHIVSGGPARIHAQQDAGPVVGLGAAGARIDFHIGVIAVRLARQQGLELGTAGARLQPLEHGARFLDQAFVAFHVAQLGELDGVLEVLFQRFDGVDRARQLRALAVDRLGLFGIVPQRRILDAGIEFVETS